MAKVLESPLSVMTQLDSTTKYSIKPSKVSTSLKQFKQKLNITFMKVKSITSLLYYTVISLTCTYKLATECVSSFFIHL